MHLQCSSKSKQIKPPKRYVTLPGKRNGLTQWIMLASSKRFKGMPQIWERTSEEDRIPLIDVTYRIFWFNTLGK